MALDIYYKEQIQSAVLAGIVLSIETAHAYGMADPTYCEGVLALARHQAQTFGISWPALAREIREALGADVAALLDMPRVIEG